MSFVNAITVKFSFQIPPVNEYKTDSGGYRGSGDRSKRNTLLMLEEMFPGFLEAMAKPGK